MGLVADAGQNPNPNLSLTLTLNLRQDCPRATQALPAKVASQLKELVWLAERDTRATRSDAQRDAAHLKASQQVQLTCTHLPLCF